MWTNQEKRELKFSQSYGDLIEKPFRVFKVKIHHFSNKIWVALILQLLKVAKLIVKNTLHKT